MVVLTLHSRRILPDGLGEVERTLAAVAGGAFQIVHLLRQALAMQLEQSS